MRHNYYAEYGNVRIRPLEERDIEVLRVLRNDTEYSKYIRKLPYITEEMQREWFAKYLEDPNIITFAIDKMGEEEVLAGSTSLYEFRPEEGLAELGKTMIEPNLSGQGLGSKSETLAIHTAFVKHKLKAVDAYIHKENIGALKKGLKDGLVIQEERYSASNDNDCHYLIAEKNAFYALHPEMLKVKISEADVKR